MRYDVALVHGDLADSKAKLSHKNIQRLNVAKKLYICKKTKKIITASGICPWFNKSKTSLADLGKKYLIGQGVPASAIIANSKSINTITELIDAKNIMVRHGWYSIIFISSEYHIWRVRRLAPLIFGGNYKIKYLETKSRSLPRALVAEERNSLVYDLEWLKYLGYKVK